MYEAHRIPESEEWIMIKKHSSVYYPEIICADVMPCSLCGQHSELQFKHGYVCEDCLIYVKAQYQSNDSASEPSQSPTCP